MLILSQISMRYGAKILFNNVSIQFNPGNHYGLIGANGSGKSTLLKIMCGEITPENGSVTLPQQLTLGSLSQDHYLYEKNTLIDVVLMGKKKLWEALVAKQDLLSKDSFDEKECQILVDLEKTIELHQGYAAENQSSELLEGLGIKTEFHRKNLEHLSGGFKLRVLLAQVLFGNPDVLILDEPTNHLDLYSIKWLESYLKNFPGTLILTSHDRNFLNQTCTHIADVDYGTVKIYKGNYDAFESQKLAIREQNELTLEKFEKKRADLQEFIDRFGAKSSKARQAQSKSRIVDKLDDQMEQLDLAPSSRIYPNLKFIFERPPGIKILKIQKINKAFGPKKVLQDISFEIERGEKVAIIGANGMGKSTLLEILTTNKDADSGDFEWGFGTKYAYFPQDHKREVKGKYSLLDWLGQFDSEISQEQLRGILGKVLFSGDTVHQPVETLSGGETARLLLAKMMLLKPNILIFDEPTNHLDIEAIDALIQSIKNFEGSVIFVSHNRYFVSELADKILEVISNGVINFKGTYPEYVEKQEKDHLDSQVVLRQRYRTNFSGNKNENANYFDHKKLKTIKSQLKKKITQLEDACHHLEKKIEEIDMRMSEANFYEKTNRNDQQKILLEKSEFEKRLLGTMEEWEKAGIELQNIENHS